MVPPAGDQVQYTNTQDCGGQRRGSTLYPSHPGGMGDSMLGLVTPDTRGSCCSWVGPGLKKQLQRCWNGIFKASCEDWSFPCLRFVSNSSCLPHCGLWLKVAGYYGGEGVASELGGSWLYCVWRQEGERGYLCSTTRLGIVPIIGQLLSRD